MENSNRTAHTTSCHKKCAYLIFVTIITTTCCVKNLAKCKIFQWVRTKLIYTQFCREATFFSRISALLSVIFLASNCSHGKWQISGMKECDSENLLYDKICQLTHFCWLCLWLSRIYALIRDWKIFGLNGLKWGVKNFWLTRFLFQKWSEMAR